MARKLTPVDQPPQLDQTVKGPEVPPETASGTISLPVVPNTGTEDASAPEVKAVPLQIGEETEGGVLVDKRKFYKLVVALIRGHTQAYALQAGIKRIGEMLGATTYQEAVDIWNRIKSQP